MFSTKHLNYLVVIVISSLVVSSCSSLRTTRPDAQKIPVVTQNPLLPVEAESSPTELSAMNPTDQSNNPPAFSGDFSMSQIAKDERSIFFAYDNYSVSSDYDGFLLNVASNIQGQDITEIRVEGNTDSRGSRAYNMALGQQRAESVKQSLVARGIPRSSITTISFGKERLLAPGNDEESHAINRRADILYSGEY